MRVHVLVLNHNGRPLLAECLPSVIAAAEASRHACEVAIVDNASTDGSPEYLTSSFPGVRVIPRPNRGLCSFNDVLAELPGEAAILLNNDIKLDRGAIDPLVEPLAEPVDGSTCFMTAPRCWLFDGRTHEGFKTAVRWRWGLVQATGLFGGHEAVAAAPDLTASAGAALAVRRELFLELGGFDPLYLPGRLEDLDFCYRGFLAGYHARYVPEAIAYHRGMSTFGPAFGRAGCDHLALRNTLLFQWKNLRHPAHRLRQYGGCAVRLTVETVRAPLVERSRRWPFRRAWSEAAERWRARSARHSPCGSVAREREFFRRFHPRRLRAATAGSEAAARDARHPVSRWYVCPLARRLAARLTTTRVRPVGLTLLGLALAALAALALLTVPALAPLAGVFVWAAWVCDRTDGELARRQGTATAWGAWLDANVDELVDLGLHAALAGAAAAAAHSSLPWALYAAFAGGKHLFFHGLDGAAAAGGAQEAAAATRSRLRRLYHLPGNADVRVHLLLAAMATGFWTAELALIALYFNVRWLARYTLVARRLRGAS